jgi:DNA invertase Pin-like site-specific DNA recombinase
MIHDPLFMPRKEKRDIPEEKAKEVVSLRKEKKTYKEIGKETGLKRHEIYNVLKENDLIGKI